MKDVLPFWMFCTRGYGYTPEMLCWSCPAEVEPYINLYEFEERKKDESAWLQGRYVYDAVIVAIDNAIMGRKSKGKYPEKPYTKKIQEESGEMSHEEKMQKVRKIFDSLQIMKANYDLSHQTEEEK